MSLPKTRKKKKKKIPLLMMLKMLKKGMLIIPMVVVVVVAVCVLCVMASSMNSGCRLGCIVNARPMRMANCPRSTSYGKIWAWILPRTTN
ncbi:hypothetical protein BCR42DRAFT_421331 [Absidia repens]|uniref:Uncharacterized protein n=1 Tax=Absidia repens TaxID=90262 RepID=A0A1X2I8P7_9FUNG|nr:hypothetical protein BCR42DRAFT_421331 [Absidia repens]